MLEEYSLSLVKIEEIEDKGSVTLQKKFLNKEPKGFLVSKKIVGNKIYFERELCGSLKEALEKYDKFAKELREDKNTFPKLLCSKEIFSKYVNIQMFSKMNMVTELVKVCSMLNISKEQYKDILYNYGEYVKTYGIKPVEDFDEE